MFKLDLDNHDEIDFLPIYKYLITEYDKGTDCPIVVLMDIDEAIILKDETNVIKNEMIFLNRKSETILRDLKKVSKKSAGILASANGIGTVLSNSPYYYVFYKIMVSVCEALVIPAPAFFIVSVMPENFKGLRGVAYPGDKDICTDILIRNDGVNIEDFVPQAKTFIHELRHVWQHKYKPEFFDDYFTLNKTNLDQYILQKAEIDANAYAYLVLKNVMNIGPDLFYRSEKEKELITKRMEEIQEEVSKKL